MTESDPPSFPRSVEIGDLDVTLRLMSAADGDLVHAFTRQLPERDLLFMRIDITQRPVIDQWIENLRSGRTITVLAEERGELIGYCSLHHSEILWTRHLGEIRMMVHPNFRGKGVGGHLARQIFAFARTQQLQKVVVQMMSSQRTAQSLFHHLGFIPEAMLHDWVIDRNGRTHDLIVMAREVDDGT